MKSGWTRSRTAVIALGLLAWSAPLALADDILTYSTSGAVGTTGVSGAGNVISFVPVQNSSVDTASNISLGYFQVAPLAAGQSTTYNDTTFTLTLEPSQINGQTVTETPITLTGYLNGTVSGPYESSVQLTFSPTAYPLGTAAGGTSSTLNLLNYGQELLVPSSVNNGQTTLQAQVVTSGDQGGTVPEPSTIMLFLSMAGGLSIRQYLQKRRKRATA